MREIILIFIALFFLNTQAQGNAYYSTQSDGEDTLQDIMLESDKVRDTPISTMQIQAVKPQQEIQTIPTNPKSAQSQILNKASQATHRHIKHHLMQKQIKSLKKTTN